MFVRWIFALAVVLVAASGAPSAAALTPSVVARRVPESGPVLAGSDVVWLENRSSSNAVPVVIARPGRNVVVRRLRPPVPPVGASIDEAFGDGVIASAGYLGVIRHLTVCGPPGYACGVSDDLLTGPLGGRLSVLASDARCQGGAITAESANLSGNVIAYAEGPSSCASSAPARIVVRDLRRPHRSRVIGAVASYPGTAAVRAAGRFVAWSDPTPSASAIVVYDLAAGRVAYRLTPRHLGTDEILGWDLQSDGKLAVAYNRAGRRSLAWLAMPDAHVHRLAGASPGSSGVGPSDASLRIARDEIAFVQHGSTLTLMDLGGHAQLIRRFTEKRAEIGGFDFDGQRLVWAEQDIKYIEVHCPTSGSGACEGKAIGPTFILSQRTAPPASPDNRASERSTGRRKAKA